MRRVIAMAMLTVASASAVADVVILHDGRMFTGETTTDGQTVTIEMVYGTVSFPMADVAEIQHKATPQEELRSRLALIDPNNPEALYDAAEWAGRHGLRRQSDELLEQVVTLRPDHAGARRALGYVDIDGQWYDIDKALQVVRSKLEAGKHQQVLDDILPSVLALAQNNTQRNEARGLLGDSQLRAGQFQTAGKTYLELAGTLAGPEAARYQVLADLLNENPDGMYVIAEPYYQPGHSALSPTEPLLTTGPASLSEPLVVAAALRQSAKEQVAQGRTLIEEARKLEESDPTSARDKYILAQKVLDRADALVSNISGSWRVEIARRQISSIRRDVQADARKYDEAMDKLGKQNLSPRAYRTMVTELGQHLTNVRTGLESILQIAEPYPQELVMEIRWAQADLKKIDAMRRILDEEIRGSR